MLWTRNRPSTVPPAVLCPEICPGTRAEGTCNLPRTMQRGSGCEKIEGDAGDAVGHKSMMPAATPPTGGRDQDARNDCPISLQHTTH